MKNTSYVAQFDENGVRIPHNGISHEFPNRQDRRQATRNNLRNTELQKVGGKRPRNVFHAKTSVIKRAIYEAGVAGDMERAKATRKQRKLAKE